jgi:hypothetical protein
LRVSIAGVVAAASLGISAASASAGDVWLWACHGPNGEAGTRTPFKQFDAPVLGGGCEAPNAAASPAGFSLKLAAGTPADGSKSSLVVELPGALGLSDATAVKVNRTLRGFEGSTGVTYRLSANNQTLETSDAPKTGALAIPDGAKSVTLDLSCSSTCASNAQVEVVSVAFLVSDNTAPSGGVAWNTPVDHKMEITPTFSDNGAGLDRAELTIGGRTTGPKYFTPQECRDLSPGEATNDRLLNLGLCRMDFPVEGKAPVGLSTTIVPWEDKLVVDKDGKSTWEYDALRLPEGLFPWTVTVYDVAGNSAQLSNTVEVWHPAEPIATRTLSISTASVTEQGSGNNNNNQNGNGGVQGSSASQCRSPRLSVVLSTKPVRVSKNVPVLKYKKAYRFKGRLTCVINGKRQSAPKRTKVSLFNKVGKKTVRKPNTAIRAKGAVDLKLAFVSDRTVIFRYTNAAGQKSEVKIKVRVTKKKK